MEGCREGRRRLSPESWKGQRNQWSMVQDWRVPRTRTWPAQDSPETTPEQGFRKPPPQPHLTPCPTCLHTKVLPSGLGLSPASSLLKALTHAVPSAWKAPPCTLHMAGSSHASGLGLNATSPESSPCAQTKDWSLIFMHSFCCD